MSALSDTVLAHVQNRAAHAADFQHPRYEISTVIGEGGMGRVYRALDRELGREVALKVLREQVADPAAADRTMQEARIIARLEHPGIVPVHDLGRIPDGRIFYVMKLVRGCRLDERFPPASSMVVGSPPLRGRSPAAVFRRSVADRLRVFERICETVAFAHAHGVIHRDLKPQNVMVGEFGEVLVLDWGVARLTRSPAGTETPIAGVAGRSPLSDGENDSDRATCRTRDGTILGTPAYMSPEQARGAIDNIDERSDVFGLGAILYFLLTGHAPLDRVSFARESKNASPEIEPPHIANPSVPHSLSAICTRALATDPVERYPSATALAADVVRFRAGEAVLAFRERLAARAVRLVWKYRAPLGLVAAYLLFRWAIIALV